MRFFFCAVAAITVSAYLLFGFAERFFFVVKLFIKAFYDLPTLRQMDFRLPSVHGRLLRVRARPLNEVFFFVAKYWILALSKQFLGNIND